MIFQPSDTIPGLLADLAILGPAGYHVSAHVRFTSSMNSWRSYNEEWTRNYVSSGMILRDPVMIWSFRNFGVARWSDLDAGPNQDVMDLAATYGMKYGACAAIGDDLSRTLLSVARSDRELTDIELDRIEDISTRFHLIAGVKSWIREGEHDILRALSEGMDMASVAAAVGLSVDECEGRLQTLRQRLEVPDNKAAIERARLFGLL